jgi:hypothetical protein
MSWERLEETYRCPCGEGTVRYAFEETQEPEPTARSRGQITFDRRNFQLLHISCPQCAPFEGVDDGPYLFRVKDGARIPLQVLRVPIPFEDGDSD